MASNTNLIEETVQALDNGGDLLRQVAGVHDECLSSCQQLKADQWTINVGVRCCEECGSAQSLISCSW